MDTILPKEGVTDFWEKSSRRNGQGEVSEAIVEVLMTELPYVIYKEFYWMQRTEPKSLFTGHW